MCASVTAEDELLTKELAEDDDEIKPAVEEAADDAVALTVAADVADVRAAVDTEAGDEDDEDALAATVGSATRQPSSSVSSAANSSSRRTMLGTDRTRSRTRGAMTDEVSSTISQL